MDGSIAISESDDDVQFVTETQSENVIILISSSDDDDLRYRKKSTVVASSSLNSDSLSKAWPQSTVQQANPQYSTSYNSKSHSYPCTMRDRKQYKHRPNHQHFRRNNQQRFSKCSYSEPHKKSCRVLNRSNFIHAPSRARTSRNPHKLTHFCNLNSGIYATSWPEAGSRDPSSSPSASQSSRSSSTNALIHGGFENGKTERQSSAARSPSNESSSSWSDSSEINCDQKSNSQNNVRRKLKDENRRPYHSEGCPRSSDKRSRHSSTGTSAFSQSSHHDTPPSPADRRFSRDTSHTNPERKATNSYRPRHWLQKFQAAKDKPGPSGLQYESGSEEGEILDEEDIEKRVEAQARQVIQLLKNEVTQLPASGHPIRSELQESVVHDWLEHHPDVQSPGSMITTPSEGVPTFTQPARPPSLTPITKQMLDKMAFKERIAGEIKVILEPHFLRGTINKDQYKLILGNGVEKVYQGSNGKINSTRIREFVGKYVSMIKENAAGRNSTEHTSFNLHKS